MMQVQARRRLMPLAALLTAVLTVMALVASFGAVGAQEEEATHPAHIHSGSCAELGDVVFPLNNVGADVANMEGTVVPMGGPTGSASAIHVDISVTTVETSLADVNDGAHAINVHESDANIGNYIACGDIGGSVATTPGGEILTIGLGELNDSGYAGVATLQDGGEGTTTVVIYLIEIGGEAAEGEAPAATEEAGGEAPAGETAVTIADFAFAPDPIDVTVGTTVTWTNQDSAPHTATGDNGEFDTGNLNQGDSGSATFDTAGTFTYHCEVHPNMTGTVNVS